MKFRKVRVQFKSVVLLLMALFLGFGLIPVLAKPMQMHVMEGFLPIGWAIFWFAVVIPFWVIGFIQIRKLLLKNLKAGYCWD